MGMGYAACSSIAFKYDDVKELCPQEVAAIENTEGFENWGEIARAICIGDDDFKHFVPLVDNLCKAFDKATETDGKGLSLSLLWYDEDSGDRYDEVEHKDNCIFDVDGVRQFTPAGNKFKDKLNYNNFVSFG